MALVVATRTDPMYRSVAIFAGGTGVSDNDVVVQADDMQHFRNYVLMTTAGAADVTVSLDGTNYSTAPLSMVDAGSASAVVTVLVTAANRIYTFSGKFQNVRVLQNGATALQNVALTASA